MIRTSDGVARVQVRAVDPAVSGTVLVTTLVVVLLATYLAAVVHY
jgi:hypothetical protein